MKLETYKNKKILITGIKGFIGNILSLKLQALGSEIIKLNDKKMDVTSWEQVKNLDKADIVFHLAAKIFVPFSFENPRKTYETNILGTLNLLEYCRKNKSKMVFASTYVYGEPNYLPVDENHPTNASNPYSKSKLVGEELCKYYSDDFGVKSIILRPFNIYGPDQNDNFLIPTIINQAKTGKIILKDSRPKRDYIYIDDAVEAFLRAGIHESNFDIFNVASGEGLSVENIAKIIISQFGNTTVNPVTTVRIVPYLTAMVPEAEHAAMPPSAASAPGSIGKKTPSSLKYSFNCFLVTFA